MREEVSLLFATVRQWVRLKADVLLYDGGDLPDARIPLERRVLGLLRATHAIATQEPRTTIRMVLPASTHPLCLHWLSMPDLQRHVRRLAAGMAELEWLEADPMRWVQLCDSVVWQEAPVMLDKGLKRVLQDLRVSPLTTNLPPMLALEYLVQAVLSSPVSKSLRMRTLDAASLRRVLTGGSERLVVWAEERGASRRLIRRQGLYADVEKGLYARIVGRQDVPERTQMWPSQHLHPRSGTVPFQGHWMQEEVLLRWCALPDDRSCHALVGPPGSGRYALAHELCQHLRELGWVTLDLSVDVLPETDADMLVVVDDAWADAETVKTLMTTPRSGRLRVLVLSEDTGTVVLQLPSVDMVEMNAIPLSERAANLQVVAAALHRKTTQGSGRLMGLPDVRLLQWPVHVSLAALGGGHGRSVDDVARAALDVERAAWLASGEDGVSLSELLVAAALGAGPWPSPYDQIPMPHPMLGLLVREHLSRDTEILSHADPAMALTLLDQMAETLSIAREWMYMVLVQDLDARLPLAAHLVVARRSTPLERPLGGLLASMGHPLPGQQPWLEPISVLSMTYSRQIFGMWPRLGQGRVSVGEDASLAQRIWMRIRDRVDVILPHQVLALEWLDRESLDALDDRLARQRMALLAAMEDSGGLAVEVLEGAVNDLGALLLTAERSRPDPEGLSMVLDEATQHRVQSMGRQLHALGGRRRKGRAASASDRLRDAERLLTALAQQHPHIIDAALLSVALEVSGDARACGKPAVAAAVLLAMLAPLERIPGQRRIPWPRPSDLLGVCAVMLKGCGKNQEAKQVASRAVMAAPHVDQTPRGMLARIVALRVRQLCDRTARTTAAQQEMLSLGRALVEANPDVYSAYLACALDQSTHMLGESERQALRMEAVEHVMGAAQVRPDLVAPFQGLSMHNLGARLHAAGIRGVGSDVTFDAADAFHRQIQQGREACQPALAGTFANLSAMLAMDGQPDQALGLIRKSLSLYGDHALQATGLSSVVDLFQRPSPALQTPQKTVALRVALRDTHLHSQPYFFWHLRLLTAALSEELDGLSLSVWAPEDARDEPARTGFGLALQNLGVLLGWGGHAADGIVALQGAAALLEAQVDGEAQNAHAEVLANLSALLLQQKQLEEALRTAALAVEQAAFGNTSGRAQGLVCQSAALIALGRGAEARDCAQAAVRAAQPFPALLVAAQHNLAVAAMATQDAELAYYASRDAIRHASKQQASPESALLLRLHRQAAARSGLPISEDAWRMEIH